jgi:serine/threonine protein kinase
MQKTVINSYEILHEIGQGGMATVYLAHDKKFDTNIAVKVLNKEFVHNENIRKRFLAEARNMYKMSHPNIIKVTDLIDDGDTVAFVMEYIEGETLKEYIARKGKLNDEEIKTMFLQILVALGYVHEQNLVHRDIKPSNFMLDKRNTVKLMDFGIAKNTDVSNSEYTQTGTGVQMGTPMYMSPEQITETKSVTAQSDIYSLGVVLWQMVTGQKPYETQTLSSFQLMTKIVNDTLPKTSTIWDDLIQKATRKEINDRFSSCHDFYGAIQLPIINKIDSSDDRTILNSSGIAENTVLENRKNQESLLEGSILANGVLKYGLINRQGNWVIQPMFDYVFNFENNVLAIAELNKKFGFINRQGNWVIQPMFDYVFNFDNNGLAQAELNEKYGFINRQGNWVIQPIFDRAGFFDNYGYASAMLNEKYGFINRQGNWVIQPIFDSVYSFDESGYAYAMLNEKYGFINRQGNWVIQPMFDSVDSFNKDAYLRVKYNQKWGVINRNGNWVIQPMFDSLDSFDDQDFAEANLNEKYGFINRKGNWVIQPMFDNVGSFDNYGYASAMLNEKNGFINRQGNWMIQPMFDSVYSFDESGYANASLNQKWGVVNRQGNWVIQPMFDFLYSFDVSGFAVAELNKKYGVINRQGSWVIQPTHLCNGVEAGIYKVSLDNKYGYMNSQGEWLIRPMFDYIKEDFEGEAMVWNEETKAWDYASTSGNRSLNQDDINDCFSHSVGKEKVYLGKNIPENKLANFSKNFNDDYFKNTEIYVYYDDTLFGKGDDGFVLLNAFSKNYLFFRIFAGSSDGICLENDDNNSFINKCSYSASKGVVINVKDQNDNETIYELGFKNEVGKGLVSLLDKYYDDEFKFDFSSGL